MKINRMLAAAISVMLSTSAFAVPILTVGSMDTLLGQTTLGNSGSANEENWIESVLLMDIDYTQLDDSSSEGDNWEAVVGGAALHVT